MVRQYSEVKLVRAQASVFGAKGVHDCRLCSAKLRFKADCREADFVLLAEQKALCMHEPYRYHDLFLTLHDRPNLPNLPLFRQLKEALNVRY
jgi:hypothetical protein